MRELFERIDAALTAETALARDFRAGGTSGCPQHRNCAYTGAEADRCPICHRTWEVICGRDERLAAYHSRGTKKPFSPRPEGIVRALHRKSHMNEHK